MPTITFVCVNFNNSIYTQRLCDSLGAQIGRGDEYLLRCVIVDNSTDDQDSFQLSQYCEPIDWVYYVHNPKNLGYFGALNLGLKRPESQESEFVVICNNDLEFDEAFCIELCNIAFEESVFALCPDVITKDNYHQNPHIIGRISSYRRFQFDLYFSHYYMACLLNFIKKRLLNKNRESSYHGERLIIHMGIGACYVLTRNFLSNFYQLDYPVFLYGEEAFFSQQIHSKGGVLLYEPKLKVHHAEGASFSDMPKRVAYESAREGYPLYRELL